MSSFLSVPIKMLISRLFLFFLWFFKLSFLLVFWLFKLIKISSCHVHFIFRQWVFFALNAFIAGETKMSPNFIHIHNIKLLKVSTLEFLFSYSYFLSSLLECLINSLDLLRPFIGCVSNLHSSLVNVVVFFIDDSLDFFELFLNHFIFH